jgi:large subunit ribosomal protein L25
MAEAATLALQPRSGRGTAECRRLRNRGLVPGNVYGHGQEPLTICAGEEELTKLIISGHQVVDVEIAGTADKAILREVQWNTFGTQVLHFDLQRVSADERIHVDVHVELRGVAPGTLTEGGVLDHHLHAVTVECFASQVPESIVVRIHELELGDAIHVSDLQLPEGVVAVNPPDEVVVQVSRVGVAPAELEAVAEGPLEPEVIGRKAEAAESDET